MPRAEGAKHRRNRRNAGATQIVRLRLGCVEARKVAATTTWAGASVIHALPHPSPGLAPWGKRWGPPTPVRVGRKQTKPLHGKMMDSDDG